MLDRATKCELEVLVSTPYIVHFYPWEILAWNGFPEQVVQPVEHKVLNQCALVQAVGIEISIRFGIVVNQVVVVDEGATKAPVENPTTQGFKERQKVAASAPVLP